MLAFSYIALASSGQLPIDPPFSVYNNNICRILLGNIVSPSFFNVVENLHSNFLAARNVNKSLVSASQS